MTDRHVASVQVIAVSYYSGEVLETMVASLEGETAVERIVIANNAPDDSEPAGIAARVPAVDALEIGANLGYGGGVNAAVERRPSSAEWILVVNPDIVFDAGSLQTLLDAGARMPQAGVLGPLIRTPIGEVYPSARRLPSLRHGVGHALFSRVWAGNPWTHAYLADRELPPRERKAGWLSGSCMLIRRTAFEAVGGFDDGYFMYFEDVDLCQRIAAAGWTNIYVPSAEVTHLGGHSTKRMSRKMIRVHHTSAYRYLRGRYDQWWLAPLRGALFIGLKVRANFAKS